MPKETDSGSIPYPIAVSTKTPFDFRKATIPTHDFHLGENKKSEHSMTTLAGDTLDL